MEKKATMRAMDDEAATLCPVARAETEVGDRWTVLILRELFAGSHRFAQIQAQTGATPQMLAARMKRLESDGLVARRLYSARPARHEYHLTAKGTAFFPVIMALRAWGESWCKSPEEGRAVEYTHAVCGKQAGLGPVCAGCGAVLRRDEMTAALAPAYRAEREARWQAFKAGR